MSFHLVFKKGPLDRQRQESRSAPQVVRVPQCDTGHYVLRTIKGSTAQMVWHPTKEAQRAARTSV